MFNAVSKVITVITCLIYIYICIYKVNENNSVQKSRRKKKNLGLIYLYLLGQMPGKILLSRKRQKNAADV